MSPDQPITAGATIFVVEDAPADVDLITKVLSKRGYRVCSILESALVMSSVQADPPDLIVLDILMSGISGYTVCEQLKANARTRDIPVIFLSGLQGTLDKMNAFAIGGVDYLTKPFQPQELLMRVETHLMLRHLQKSLQEENLRLEQEINDRKEAEQSLRITEQRLRSIFKNVTFGIFQTTLQGKLLTVNPALARMLGYSSTQEMLKTVTNLADQLFAEPDHWQKMIETIQSSKEQAGIETTLRCKDGAEILGLFKIWAVRDKDGNILYFEGSLENVTERKRIEETINKQLKFLDEIFTGIQEGIGFIDVDDMLIYCNPACNAIFEESLDRLIGRNLLDFFDDPSQTTIRHGHKKLRKGQKTMYEVSLTTTHGNHKVLLITVSPRFRDDGVYIGAFVTLVNSTEYKRTEDLLRKLEKAAETTDIGIILTDGDGRMVYTNPAVARMHGYPVAELIGQHPNMLTLPEFQESEESQELEPGFEELFGFPPERINVRKDRSQFPVKVVSNPIKGKDGQQFGTVMICEDITQRKQAEEALMKQANLLRGVAGAMSALLATGDFQAAMAQALEILGLVTDMDRITIFQNQGHPDTGEPLMNLRFRWALNVFELEVDTAQFQHLAYKKMGLARWYERLSSNSVISGLVQDFPESERTGLESEDVRATMVIPIMIRDQFWGFIRFDSCQTDRQWTEDQESSLLALTGSIGGMIARQETEAELIKTNTELTATLKHLQQMHLQLADQQAELKQLNASKDKFFSIIAHDLRNPFSGLLGITDFIVKNVDQFSPQDIQEHVASLRDSAKNVYTLIENLLDWSRLQRGVMEHHPALFAFDEIAANNVGLFKPIADQKHLTLFNQVPKGTIVYADKHMIDTVIRNLTSNALKFTHPGGLIAIAATTKGPTVEVSISDTGTGIPKEDLSKLFQIDVKYSNVGTAGEEGTGLGLILCKDLVEKNGGKIRVESEVGQGTVFIIDLPVNTP
jgi:PAS domain S-box-containing protein